jgi:hypothetical protein
MPAKFSNITSILNFQEDIAIAMLEKYENLTRKCEEGDTSPGMCVLGITVPFVQHSAILKLYPLHKH